ncbi:hypothetical protein DPMN_044488 [Dreissena polymorpha]|uniref:Uncharacterized protein n=1 Tax=Dreissena polymorpha TaxID=45954 RepID=A0A9D4HWI4_DREPO|nr:hypothetical protein DPMN_044488 [Dreissena polymorpha]
MPHIREGDIGTENPLYNADVINDNHAVIEVTALVNLPDETDIETENPLYNADDNIQYFIVYSN